MCCSNTDCENIRAAFEEGEYDCVEPFIRKKLTRLTEFEKCMLDFAEARDEYEFDSTKVVELNNKVIELTKSYAKKLLAIAKKELLSYADESNPAIEAMADLERAVTCGNVDNIPKWLTEELNKAFKKGQELSHEDYIQGYNKGYKDAEKWYNNRVASRSPIMPTPLSGWGCDGTHCTNPQMDCINCPRKNIGGGFNMQSGTSAAKAEG